MVTAIRRRDLRTCGIAIATMAIFIVLNFVGSDFAWLRRLETVALDVRLQIRGAVPPGPEVVVVMIDDKTIAEEGRWPLSRAKFARAVDNLRRAGAKVIAFDVLFTEPETRTSDDTLAFLEARRQKLADHGVEELINEARGLEENGDDVLARAIRSAGNVLLPFAYTFGEGKPQGTPAYIERAAYTSLRANGAPPPSPLRPSGVLAPIPALANAAAGLGHAVVAFDVDGAPRYDYPVIDYDLDYYPSMPIKIVQMYLALPWEAVAVKFGDGISIGPVWLPTDPSMRTLVNYRGPIRTFPTFPFSRLLANTIPPSLLQDRIVLIGTNITGIRDTFRTPFTSVLPGVERLAAMVDATLHGDTLRRLREAPFIEAALLIVSALLIGFSVARLRVVWAAVVTFAVFVSLAIGGHLALAIYGMWFTAAVPTAGMLVTFTVVLGYRIRVLDREHRRVRQAFGRYLAPKMVERLSQDTDTLHLGGELRELTILFCDVRRFSAISESLDPQRLTSLVNEFFTPMTEAILAHGGTIDKYIGDGIMAFWNAPLNDASHAEHACRAALLMIASLEKLNARWQRDKRGMGPIEIGIGINTGPCTVGNFGSNHRFDYSALGDAVNVAARLEGETKSYRLPIIVGPETATRAPMLATLPVDNIRVRGRAKPIEIFGLIGDEKMLRDPVFIKLHQEHLYLRAACQARDWDLAEKALKHLTAIAPKPVGHLYDSFIERVAHFRNHPPASDWDGSFLVERRHASADVVQLKSSR